MSRRARSGRLSSRASMAGSKRLRSHELQHQAFAQVAGADADRLEALQGLQHLFEEAFLAAQAVGHLGQVDAQGSHPRRRNRSARRRRRAPGRRGRPTASWSCRCSLRVLCGSARFPAHRRRRQKPVEPPEPARDQSTAPPASAAPSAARVVAGGPFAGRGLVVAGVQVGAGGGILDAVGGGVGGDGPRCSRARPRRRGRRGRAADCAPSSASTKASSSIFDNCRSLIACCS